MAELEYSVEALNVKSAFYRATAMVYVEGDDDVLFWEEIFSKVPDFFVEIEAVGGASELDKYITKIQANDVNAIAARDADFLRFSSNTVSSPRIIYTQGYSIENSLYTAELIHHVARSWCKTRTITEYQCIEWLNKLGTSFGQLIILDIANAMADAGVMVLQDNCTRFMTSQTSDTPCHRKIDLHVQEVTSKIPAEVINITNETIRLSQTTSLQYLRGHLLASAVIKFVLQLSKTFSKKINISADSLYAAAITSFRHLYTATHPHYDYYHTAVTMAAATFRLRSSD